ncbi:hypothetical protein SAMN04488128_10696 [Chitinophaga eiseniae]|uniref:Uncharacterized protein n=1 Tax=Chitinophaga eiseniae TaxID=634771 RepID=A0A1T4TRY0_9BACT|nr:hypothetical protein SAMN04488128_10696 [Chitinophaga eiseniae]
MIFAILQQFINRLYTNNTFDNALTISERNVKDKKFRKY